MCGIIRQLFYTLFLCEKKIKKENNMKNENQHRKENENENDNDNDNVKKEDYDFCQLIVITVIQYLIYDEIFTKDNKSGRKKLTFFQILNSVFHYFPVSDINNIFDKIKYDNTISYDDNLKIIIASNNDNNNSNNTTNNNNNNDNNISLFCNCVDIALNAIILNFENDLNNMNNERDDSEENILKESEEASLFVALLVNKVEKRISEKK